MNRYYLILLILPLTFAFNTKAEILQLRIQGSNTVGAQLAPNLVQSWLIDKDYASPRVIKNGELTTLQAEKSDGDTIEVSIEAKGSSTGFKGLQQGT